MYKINLNIIFFISLLSKYYLSRRRKDIANILLNTNNKKTI